MPLNAIRGLRLARRAGMCVVRPECRDRLAGLGLADARDFLALPGVVVSGHVGRNVSRVELGGDTAYLKREHHVRVRDRFRSWCAGLGWRSMSEREAAVLRRLEQRSVPVPRWLAFGSADGQGYLLLAAAGPTTDLRSCSVVGRHLAEAIGRFVARVHAAGVDQPDLFAKHVLVNEEAGELTVLDWQRAAIRSSVAFRRRARTLAALRATAPPELFPRPIWEGLVSAYLAEARGLGLPVTERDRFSRRIDRQTDCLLRRPGIREQRNTGPGISQELVRIDGERVCVIPSIACAFRAGPFAGRVYDGKFDGRLLELPGDRTGMLRVGRYKSPWGRWWAALRGRSWRSRELRQARLLFHLERHAIPAPRLLAYGQLAPMVAPARSFVLFEPLASEPPVPADGGGLHGLLDRLHTAGCRLACVGPRGEPFGMTVTGPAVCDPTRLRLDRRLGRRRIRRDHAMLDTFLRGQR